MSNAINQTNTNTQTGFEPNGALPTSPKNVVLVNDADWENLQHRLDEPSTANDALATLLQRGKQLVSHSTAR